ncbi:hypothetical protein ACJMK2_014431, partial [Sinanodonta woodiana]
AGWVDVNYSAIVSAATNMVTIINHINAYVIDKLSSLGYLDDNDINITMQEKL